MQSATISCGSIFVAHVCRMATHAWSIAADTGTGMITAMRLVMLSLTIFLLVSKSRRKVWTFLLLRLLRLLNTCVMIVMVVVMVVVMMMVLRSNRNNCRSSHRHRHTFGMLSNGWRIFFPHFVRWVRMFGVTAAAAANRNCHLIIDRRRNDQIIRFRFGRMIGARIFGGANARISTLRVSHGSCNFTI